MSNAWINISAKSEVKTGLQTMEINPGRYSVSETLCKENDFLFCHGCKEYFDEINTLGIYHEKYDERKIKDYCNTCFNKKYPN